VWALAGPEAATIEVGEQGHAREATSSDGAASTCPIHLALITKAARDVLTGGRERLHLDLRTALHDDGVRAGRARGTRRWREHELRIRDWCLAGSCIYELRDELGNHHNFIGFHPAAPWAPSGERLPNEAVGSPELRSQTGADRNESVAVESWVPVESPAKSVATPATLGLGRYSGNEKKSHCQERDRRYTSHFIAAHPLTVEPQTHRCVNRTHLSFSGVCAVSLHAPSLSF